MNSRTGLYVSLLAIVVAFALGWAFGLATSTRINTAAAKSYAEALDLQSAAAHKAELARCVAQAADDNVTYAKNLRDLREELSERIIGLRVQLQAAGIRERVEGTQ